MGNTKEKFFEDLTKKINDELSGYFCGPEEMQLLNDDIREWLSENGVPSYISPDMVNMSAQILSVDAEVYNASPLQMLYTSTLQEAGKNTEELDALIAGVIENVKSELLIQWLLPNYKSYFSFKFNADLDKLNDDAILENTSKIKAKMVQKLRQTIEDEGEDLLKNGQYISNEYGYLVAEKCMRYLLENGYPEKFNYTQTSWTVKAKLLNPSNSLTLKFMDDTGISELISGNESSVVFVKENLNQANKLIADAINSIRQQSVVYAIKSVSMSVDDSFDITVQPAKSREEAIELLQTGKTNSIDEKILNILSDHFDDSIPYADFIMQTEAFETRILEFIKEEFANQPDITKYRKLADWTVIVDGVPPYDTIVEGLLQSVDVANLSEDERNEFLKHIKQMINAQQWDFKTYLQTNMVNWRVAPNISVEDMKEIAEQLDF